MDSLYNDLSHTEEKPIITSFPNQKLLMDETGETSNTQKKLENILIIREQVLNLEIDSFTRLTIFHEYLIKPVKDNSPVHVEAVLTLIYDFIQINKSCFNQINLNDVWKYIENFNNSIKRFPQLLENILKLWIEFGEANAASQIYDILKSKRHQSVVFMCSFLSNYLANNDKLKKDKRISELIQDAANSNYPVWLKLAAKKVLPFYENEGLEQQKSYENIQEEQSSPQKSQEFDNLEKQNNMICDPQQNKPYYNPLKPRFCRINVLQQKKLQAGNAKKQKVEQPVEESLEDLMKYGYSNYPSLSNQQKLISLKTLHRALAKSEPEQIQSSKFNADDILLLCNIQNTVGIELLVKIILQFVNSCHVQQEQNLKKNLPKIFLELFKNSRTSWKIVIQQMKDLFEFLINLEKFNNQLHSILLESLQSSLKHVEIIGLDLTRLVLLKGFFKQFEQNEVLLKQVVHIHLTHHNKLIQQYTVQILVEEQEKIGSKIQKYLTDFNFYQLRAFNKASQSSKQQSNSLELTEKEQNKLSEIEWMLSTCSNKERLESLFSLIENEINHYRYMPLEFGLRYNLIFSKMLNQNTFSVEMQQKVFQLLKRFSRLFKPREKAAIFDALINLQSKHLTSELRASIFIEFAKELGIEFFYSRIISILESGQRMGLSSVIVLLKWAIPTLKPVLLTEFIEMLIKSISLNEKIINNQIFNFLAQVDFIINDKSVSQIVNAHAEYPGHLMKKIQEQKAKIVFLAKKRTNNALNVSDTFSLISKDLDSKDNLSIISALHEENDIINGFEPASQFSVIQEETELDLELKDINNSE